MPAIILKVSPDFVPSPNEQVSSEREAVRVEVVVPFVKVKVAVGVAVVLSNPEVGILSPLQLCKYLVWVVLEQPAKLLK